MSLKSSTRCDCTDPGAMAEKEKGNPYGLPSSEQVVASMLFRNNPVANLSLAISLAPASGPAIRVRFSLKPAIR